MLYHNLFEVVIINLNLIFGGYFFIHYLYMYIVSACIRLSALRTPHGQDKWYNYLKFDIYISQLKISNNSQYNITRHFLKKYKLYKEKYLKENALMIK